MTQLSASNFDERIRASLKTLDGYMSDACHICEMGSIQQDMDYVNALKEKGFEFLQNHKDENTGIFNPEFTWNMLVKRVFGVSIESETCIYCGK